MRKNHRGGRIGEEIRRIISDMLLRELKDPRFTGLVSISGVKASDDGTFATVFVTVLSGSAQSDPASEAREQKAVIAAFESAKGVLRHEIGMRLGLRHTPDLRFKIDTSEDYGRHIDALIDGLGLPPTDDGAIDNSTGESADLPSGDASADALAGKSGLLAMDDGSIDASAGDPGSLPMDGGSIDALADAIHAADSIHVFPHENMDGDTLGSAIGLCLALSGIGKVCHVVVDEKIPDNIAFLDQCAIAAPDRLPPAELSILIDVGETERIGARAALFSQGGHTMCIDHHMSSKPVYDYNYIDTEAAATAEIVYDLLKRMGIPIGKEAAEALYTGIVTDTGRFQFGNTSASALRAAADLIESGVVPSRIATEVYQSVRVEKLYLENAILGTMQMTAGGKGVTAYMTRQMLLETGAMDEETEGIAEKLRGIRGVELAVFLRETENGRTKASMRSRSWYDVAALAGHFGGGGHIRAAGFTSDLPIFELRDQIKEILDQSL